MAHTNLLHTGRIFDKDLRVFNTISIRYEGPTIALGESGGQRMAQEGKLRKWRVQELEKGRIIIFPGSQIAEL